MNDQTQQLPKQPAIVVIGGGVVGAACAYYLKKGGAAVTVIDRGEFGSACSHANCGFISPSHILPLCQPGAISSTLKTMFKKDSAFSVKMRFDFELFKWMLRFARKCNHQEMLAAGHARQALLNSSRELYQSLIESDELHDCDWETQGMLFVHDSEHHFREYAETDKLLREEYGLAGKSFAGEALNELEPALKPGIAGGWLYEGDAHVRPDKVMSAWKSRLLANEVQIIENCEFRSIVSHRGSISAIESSTGTIKADQVVFATGAWSSLLAKQLQAKIPVQPGKGYSLTMPRPTVCPKYPMIFEEHRVAITPMQTGYRIGSTMEFAGFDSSIPERRLDLLFNGAKHYLKEPTAEPIEEKWYGWRPMSADGVPLIGRVPRYQNAWMAAGHSMLGLSMGTGTGRLLAEMINGVDTHIDPKPYRLDRF